MAAPVLSSGGDMKAILAALFCLAATAASAQEPPAAKAGGANGLQITAVFFNPTTNANTQSFPRGSKVGYRVSAAIPNSANDQNVSFTLSAVLHLARLAIPIPLGRSDQPLVRGIPIENPEGNTALDFASRYEQQGTFTLPAQMHTGSIDVVAKVTVDNVGSSTVTRTLKVTP